ncbi:hypothetical protein HQ584_07540 [Patescibacteria group bacterium]|nr:hypothetical protein [Patescibacteria group bacterium]
MKSYTWTIVIYPTNKTIFFDGDLDQFLVFLGNNYYIAREFDAVAKSVVVEQIKKCNT